MSLKPEAITKRPGWHKHPYGGGWVHDTATVAESAYVASTAEVCANAWVGNNAWIYDNQKVPNNGVIFGTNEVYEG